MGLLAPSVAGTGKVPTARMMSPNRSAARRKRIARVTRDADLQIAKQKAQPLGTGG